MLRDDEIERYARQVVIPGVGAAGQEKLLQSTVLVVGHPRGCATAELYLRAAGVRVVTEVGSASADAIVVADVDALGDEKRAALLARHEPICWYALRDDAFIVGVHPEAPILPSPGIHAEYAGALHDGAACEASAMACGLLLHLGLERGPCSFSI